jgi:hypothetical protein
MTAERPPRPAWMIGGIMLLLAFSPVLAADPEVGGRQTDSQAAQSKAAASSQAASSVASSLPSSQPSSQPTEETWPPGLLMKVLEKADARKPLDDAGIRLWGFTEAGLTGDLTNGQEPLFGRLYDARRPNNARLNQLQLTTERPYDNKKDFDWGFRVDGVFGGDPKLTHAAGLLDKSGEGQGDDWTDVVQAHAQSWFKTGNDSGLEVTFGKFLEPAGSEAAEAIYNALYSHSYIYSFDEPTTLTGMSAKYYLNSQVFGYLGVVEGWDVFEDNNHGVTFITGGGWSSSDQVGSHPKTQVLLNVFTGPEQASNSRDYRTLTDIVINYWWTDKLSEALNIDWLTEENVPDVGRANAYGPAHYLTYVFNDRVSATWRMEWFRDDTGVRIGAAGNYYENTVGLNLTPWPVHGILKNLSFRPEARWDNSDQRVFGGSHDQMTVAFDVLFKF